LVFFKRYSKEDIKEEWLFVSQVQLHTHLKLRFISEKEEGGRHTPFHNNYRPQFYVRTTDVTGIITLPEGVVMPGDNLTIDVVLLSAIALSVGLRSLSVKVGTVGAGQVTDCSIIL
jgi:elongation factor Tu